MSKLILFNVRFTIYRIFVPEWVRNSDTEIVHNRFFSSFSCFYTSDLYYIIVHYTLCIHIYSMCVCVVCCVLCTILCDINTSASNVLSFVCVMQRIFVVPGDSAEIE